MHRNEADIAGYYGGPDLLAVILAAAGEQNGRLRPEVLEKIDEFHVGGFVATERLLDGMGQGVGKRLLDIGSGVGGPARRAARRGWSVTGVDLTARFVAVASELSQRAEVDHGPVFYQGSALDLPFDQASFDGVMMIHVGMNIEDKTTLMAEVARVLRPDGIFGLYDLMRLDDDPLPYPMPWADRPEISFIARAETYHQAAKAAGLHITAEIPRIDEAKTFFAQMREVAAQHAASGLPPPPGIGLVMGQDAPIKLSNLATAIMQDRVGPFEMHFKKKM